MGDKLFIENSITINASPAIVWDVLINPEQTKKYMFGCETVSDWKVGSPLLWKGNYEGNDVIFVKGIILDIQPEKRLSYTAIDPNNSSIPDLPENYLTVTYELKEENGQTVLSVSQGDYSKVAEGKMRYEHSVASGGWESILDSIKNLLEKS